MTSSMLKWKDQNCGVLSERVVELPKAVPHVPSNKPYTNLLNTSS